MDPNPEDLQKELERLRRENEELKKKLRDSVPPEPVTPQPPQQLSIPSAELLGGRGADMSSGHAGTVASIVVDERTATASVRRKERL